MNVSHKNDLTALGLLNRGPMHGYRIMQIVQAQLEPWASISASSVYNALGRLTRRGAISQTTEREGKAPERTVYHLTPKGRELLADLVRRCLPAIGTDMPLFYLGLHFAEALPTAEVIALLEARLRVLEQASAHMCTTERDVRQDCPELFHFAWMCAAGERHMQVEIEMCRDLVAKLRAQPDYFEQLGGKLSENWRAEC
jgi:DNA-binding PadR family transcriptional regulator